MDLSGVEGGFFGQYVAVIATGMRGTIRSSVLLNKEKASHVRTEELF
tara:strand:- start:37 stop:177 length:141 start_codon:yes stop_codon:yes gene_type:complete